MGPTGTGVQKFSMEEVEAAARIKGLGRGGRVWGRTALPRRVEEAKKKLA